MVDYVIMEDGGNHTKYHADKIDKARNIAYSVHLSKGHDVIIWKNGKWYALVGSVFVKGERHIFLMTREKKYLLTLDKAIKKYR